MEIELKSTGIVGGLLMLALVFAAFYGYIANIFKLVSTVGAFGMLELCRIVGIVIPFVGSLLGFVN